MMDETDCADWMSHLPDKLWKVPLWNLAIPGQSFSEILALYTNVVYMEMWLLMLINKLSHYLTFIVVTISGSHDTMTYHLDDHSPIVPSESFFLRLFDKCFPCVTRPYVKRWATTQVGYISTEKVVFILNYHIRGLTHKLSHSHVAGLVLIIPKHNHAL